MRQTFLEITHELLKIMEEKCTSKTGEATHKQPELNDGHNKKRQEAITDLIKAIAQVKHEAFSSENEWRLTILRRVGNRNLKFRQGRSSIVPYVELLLADEGNAISSIKRIVVGPSPRQEDAIEALKMLLTQKNYKLQEDGADSGVVIERSRIPFRD